MASGIFSQVLWHTVSFVRLIYDKVSTLIYIYVYLSLLFFFLNFSYNRSKSVEEFENLTVKLCERYIGAETQSTCNIWFSKKAPGSARKRSLLVKRGNGQSPEKRLTHLARRRKTFCSANLQGLGRTNKKQLMVQIKYVAHLSYKRENN